MAEVVKPAAKQDVKPGDQEDKPAEHKSEDVWYVVGFAGGNVTSYGEYDNKRDAEETASSIAGSLVLPSSRKVVEE